MKKTISISLVTVGVLSSPTLAKPTHEGGNTLYLSMLQGVQPYSSVVLSALYQGNQLIKSDQSKQPGYSQLALSGNLPSSSSPFSSSASTNRSVSHQQYSTHGFNFPLAETSNLTRDISEKPTGTGNTQFLSTGTLARLTVDPAQATGNTPSSSTEAHTRLTVDSAFSLGQATGDTLSSLIERSVQLTVDSALRDISVDTGNTQSSLTNPPVQLTVHSTLKDISGQSTENTQPSSTNTTVNVIDLSDQVLKEISQAVGSTVGQPPMAPPLPSSDIPVKKYRDRDGLRLTKTTSGNQNKLSAGLLNALQKGISSLRKSDAGTRDRSQLNGVVLRKTRESLRKIRPLPDGTEEQASSQILLVNGSPFKAAGLKEGLENQVPPSREPVNLRPVTGTEKRSQEASLSIVALEAELTTLTARKDMFRRRQIQLQLGKLREEQASLMNTAIQSPLSLLSESYSDNPPLPPLPPLESREGLEVSLTSFVPPPPSKPYPYSDNPPPPPPLESLEVLEASLASFVPSQPSEPYPGDVKASAASFVVPFPPSGPHPDDLEASSVPFAPPPPPGVPAAPSIPFAPSLSTLAVVAVENKVGKAMVDADGRHNLLSTMRGAGKKVIATAANALNSVKTSVQRLVQSPKAATGGFFSSKLTQLPSFFMDKFNKGKKKIEVDNEWGDNDEDTLEAVNVGDKYTQVGQGTTGSSTGLVSSFKNFFETNKPVSERANNDNLSSHAGAVHGASEPENSQSETQIVPVAPPLPLGVPVAPSILTVGLDEMNEGVNNQAKATRFVSEPFENAQSGIQDILQTSLLLSRKKMVDGNEVSRLEVNRDSLLAAIRGNPIEALKSNKLRVNQMAQEAEEGELRRGSSLSVAQTLNIGLTQYRAAMTKYDGDEEEDENCDFD